MDVIERGVPNKEAIALTANEAVNMGQFGLMVGRHYVNNSFVPPNGAYPYHDHLFWFGDGLVKRGDWLFVYTGSGTPGKNLAADGVSDSYRLFWGKSTTLFAESNVVPILFRVDAVYVSEPPSNQPQRYLRSGRS